MEKRWIHTFPKSETQLAEITIWTWLAEFLFYKNNHYATYAAIKLSKTGFKLQILQVPVCLQRIDLKLVFLIHYNLYFKLIWRMEA